MTALIEAERTRWIRKAAPNIFFLSDVLCDEKLIICYGCTFDIWFNPLGSVWTSWFASVCVWLLERRFWNKSKNGAQKGLMWRVKPFCRFMLRIYSSLRRIAKLNNTRWKLFLRDRSLWSLAPVVFLLKLPGQMMAEEYIARNWRCSIHSSKCFQKSNFYYRKIFGTKQK